MDRTRWQKVKLGWDLGNRNSYIASPGSSFACVLPKCGYPAVLCPPLFCPIITQYHCTVDILFNSFIKYLNVICQIDLWQIDMKNKTFFENQIIFKKINVFSMLHLKNTFRIDRYYSRIYFEMQIKLITWSSNLI